MDKIKKAEYLTTAPQKVQMTINNGNIFPNEKKVPGDSVDHYEFLKEANIQITGKEILQQNENL